MACPPPKNLSPEGRRQFFLLTKSIQAVEAFVSYFPSLGLRGKLIPLLRGWMRCDEERRVELIEAACAAYREKSRTFKVIKTVPDHLWNLIVGEYKNRARHDPFAIYLTAVAGFMMGEAPRGHVLRSVPLVMEPPSLIFFFEKESLCPEQVPLWVFFNLILRIPALNKEYDDDYSFSLAGPIAALPQILSKAKDLSTEPPEVCVCGKRKNNNEEKAEKEKEKESEESTDESTGESTESTADKEKAKEDNTTEKKPAAISMKLCGQCKEQRYCSSECQKADWQRHKAFCTVFKDDEISRASYFKSVTNPKDYTDGWKPPRDPTVPKGNYYCVDCGREHGVFNEHMQKDLNENAPPTILLPNVNEDGVLEGLKAVIITTKKKKNGGKKNKNNRRR